MQPIMLVAGVFLLSLALRTMEGAVMRKLSVLGFLTTSFLLGWLFTGSWWMGVAFVAFWLVWPWYELITRVRKIAMPEEKTLRHKSPPHREAFPGLEDMTEEIEGEEYDHLDDLGRDWESSQQFFRIFHKPDERTQVAICLVDRRIEAVKDAQLELVGTLEEVLQVGEREDDIGDAGPGARHVLTGGADRIHAGPDAVGGKDRNRNTAVGLDAGDLQRGVRRAPPSCCGRFQPAGIRAGPVQCEPAVGLFLLATRCEKE